MKSWAFRGRVNGRPKKITLGTFPGVDLTAARDLAGAARKAAHAGVVFAPPEPSPDPEAAPATPEGRSVSEVWKQYRALRLEPECRETTVAEHARIFQNHIEPLLGSRDIGTIARLVVSPIADAALVRGFEARNKTVAVMTGFFGWCHEERDLIDKSPLRGLKQRSAKTNQRPEARSRRCRDKGVLESLRRHRRREPVIDEVRRDVQAVAVDGRSPQRVESPGGVSPPGAHRSGRERLRSSGSYRPAAVLCSIGQWANSVGVRQAMSRTQCSARLRCRRRRLYFDIAHRARHRSRWRSVG